MYNNLDDNPDGSLLDPPESKCMIPYSLLIVPQLLKNSNSMDFEDLP
jgi:hypothetical protein